MSFSHTVRTSMEIDEAIEKLTTRLKSIDFGVLEILDFQKILTDKGISFRDNYRLLQVCNPNLAKQVLDANPDLGLLLPCTIAVYQKDNENYISLAKPTSLLAMASEKNLTFSGEVIEDSLISIIDNL